MEGLDACVSWNVFFLGEDWFSSLCWRMWWCPRGGADGIHCRWEFPVWVSNWA